MYGGGVDSLYGQIGGGDGDGVGGGGGGVGGGGGGSSAPTLPSIDARRSSSAPDGRAVQVDTIKTRVESASGFRA